MTEPKFSDLAKHFLGQALEDGIDGATLAARQLRDMEQDSSMALSEFLHGVNFRWKDFEPEEGDSFQKFAVRATGYDPATIQRKVCSYEWLTGEYIPKSYRDVIEKNFTTKMLKKAYKVSLKHKNNRHTGKYDFIPTENEIESADWLALSECVDDAMLIGVLQSITGKEPNKNRMAFKVDKDGNVWLFKGKQEGIVLFTLNIHSKNPVILSGNDEVLERIGATEFE